jgi:hypothetical protein
MRGAAQATRITAAQFAAAEKRLVGTELAGTQTAVAMTKVTKATKSARKGIGTIRSAGASLTSRLVGLNGTLGTFAGAMGQFAIGSVVTIGIIAGIAAVGGAMKLLTRDTKKAEEAFKAMLERLKSDIPEATKVTLAGIKAMLEAQKELLQVRISAAIDPSVAGKLSPLAKQLYKDLFQVEIALQHVGAAWKELEDADIAKMLDAQTAALQRQHRFTFENIIDRQDQARIATEQAERAIQALADRWTDYGKTSLEVLRENLREISVLVDMSKMDLPEATAAVQRLLKEFKDGLEQTDPVLDKTIDNIERLTTALFNLSRGLSFNFGGALLGGIFGAIRGGPVGGIIGAIGGGVGVPGLRPEDLGIGGSSGATTQIVMAPAVDPLTIARDAQWMNVVAATNQALANTGHRIEVVGG